MLQAVEKFKIIVIKKIIIKKIVTIEKYCDNWKRLWLKNHVSNEINFSSNVNEVIRAISSLFVLFYKTISHAQKAQKAQKAQRRNQAKAQKRKQVNKWLFPLKCFLSA